MKNQSLFHPDRIPRRPINGPILPRGFPVSGCSSAICARSVGVFPVKDGEEVPLGISTPDARFGGKIPGFRLVEVDLGDRVNAEGFPGYFPLKIIPDEFLVGWVEAESWR